MTNVRGKEKSPGEFRHSQNWIGSSNSTIKNAKYIPPTVVDMHEALSDLEKYINSNDMKYDPLIKIALIHYQFETIHPFLDGNGRIGRMLITLCLLSYKIINYPILYISYFLKKEQQDYFLFLNNVREKDKYEEWIKFFLDVFINCVKEVINLINKINNILTIDLNKINNCKANKNLKKIFNFLVVNPITNITILAHENKLTFMGIKKNIAKLVNLKILKLQNEKKKFKVYYYQKYIDALKEE